MLSIFSAKRNPGWMSVLTCGGKVTLAHVVRNGAGRPEVRRFESFAVENGLAEALKRLRAAFRFESYACTTLIPAEACNVTQMGAPPVPAEERKEALRWALKEMVDYPVDSACIDVIDIPADGLPPERSSGVLVVSAAEQAVRACVAPFEEAKIRLDAVDIQEMAQRNVAALFEDENRGLAFLRIDEDGLTLTLTFHGELVAVRRGEMNTQQLNSDDAEHAARVRAARVRERLVLELQRSLDNFDRQYSHIPVSKVVLACCPAVENLADDLRESSYVPVIEMDLSSVIDFPENPELKESGCQVRSLLAIGAALRGPSPQGAAS